jgi:hypothetical protein
MMYASLEQAGAQHSLSPGNAWGGGSGDHLAMRLHDLKRELIRGYVEGKQAPARAGFGPEDLN